MAYIRKVHGPLSFALNCIESLLHFFSCHFQSLFCDVRQLMAYIKEVHGGTYRRVALSGLLDSMQKLRREVVQKERENKLKMSTPIRCDFLVFV